MCLAVPAKIISISGIYAISEYMSFKQKINIELIDKPKPGEYVLVHAGFAIEKIDHKRYLYLNDFYNEAIYGYNDV